MRFITYLNLEIFLDNGEIFLDKFGLMDIFNGKTSVSYYNCVSYSTSKVMNQKNAFTAIVK